MGYTNCGTITFDGDKETLVNIINNIDFGAYKDAAKNWAALIENGEIQLEDFAGDIDQEIRKIVAAATEAGIKLEGEIQSYQSCDVCISYYVIGNGVVSCIGEEEYALRNASDEMLIAELERRRGRIMFRNDYFATKVWSREDVECRMRDNGYKAFTEEDVDAVVKHGGKWPYLNDCSDGDWECIDEEIDAALGTADDFNASKGSWYAINIKWDTEGVSVDDLPEETEIPWDVIDTDFDPNNPDYADEVTDYLSDIYGWCLDGYGMEFRKKEAA